MGQMQKIGQVATTVRTVNDPARGDVTTVVYHNTIVVQFDRDAVKLDHGGWDTPTTKVRMNQASNQFDLGFHVSQMDFDWYVNTPAGEVIKFPSNGRVEFPRN